MLTTRHFKESVCPRDHAVNVRYPTHMPAPSRGRG